MANLLGFFQMHGYGFYIWSAYAVVMISFLVTLLRVKKHHHHVRQKLRQWFENHASNSST